MKHVIWLPNWYPNKVHPFHGDFIQRHARSTALYDHVYVLYILDVTAQGIETKSGEEKKSAGNLTEHVIYYNTHNFPVLGKLYSLVSYYRLYFKYIRKYRKKLGNPVYIHVHVPVKTGIVALWMKFRHGIPFLFTEHYGIYNRIVEDPFENRSFLFRFFTRQIIRHASFFLPVSKQIGDAINAMIVPKPFTVIPNTVDCSFFNWQASTRKKFRFIHVSSMYPLKNVEGIIDAVSHLWQQRQDFELVIVGPSCPAVHKFATRLGLTGIAISFQGEMPYSAVAEQMKASDALILFSRTENMPCVILESLCCGRPVIATRVGGIPEVVNEENGFLVESEDVYGLSEAMQRMMDMYHLFDCAEIASRSEKLYSYAAIGKKISAIYKQ